MDQQQVARPSAASSSAAAIQLQLPTSTNGTAYSANGPSFVQKAAAEARYATMQAGKKLSPCDVAALKKCLEQNKGDRHKVGQLLLARVCSNFRVTGWYVCVACGTGTCVQQTSVSQCADRWAPLKSYGSNPLHMQSQQGPL
jgi:hypothetical protein